MWVLEGDAHSSTPSKSAGKGRAIGSRRLSLAWVIISTIYSGFHDAQKIPEIENTPGNCYASGPRLDYEGSLTLPQNLMCAAGIAAYEAVHVWNVTRGTRIETYAIEGEEGSRDICANGAAAHLIRPGDIIIVATFEYQLDSVAQQSTAHPRVVFVDQFNQMIRVGREMPGPRRRGAAANSEDSCC